MWLILKPTSCGCWKKKKFCKSFGRTFANPPRNPCANVRAWREPDKRTHALIVWYCRSSTGVTGKSSHDPRHRTHHSSDSWRYGRVILQLHTCARRLDFAMTLHGLDLCCMIDSTTTKSRCISPHLFYHPDASESSASYVLILCT